MSIRYDMPNEEELDQRATEQDKKWKTLTDEETKNDPAFQRWKTWHWSIVWILTLVSVGGYFAFEISVFKQSPRGIPRGAFQAPFGLGAILLSAGTWLYMRKVRAIGMRAWSKKRDEESAKLKAAQNRGTN